MHTITPNVNTGVIINPPRETDLHVGSANDFAIPAVLNNQSDWRQYECDGEWQKDMAVDFESNACMSFASENTIATYLNWLLQTNQLPATHVDFLKTNGYVGTDGKIALSGRFTAKMSGTTQNGNDFQNPWDSIQSDGVVPDSVWPMPATQLNADPANAWNIYYAEPTPDVLALGKAFLTFFSIEWRWLVSNGSGAPQADFVTWLKVAPVHVAIQVCPPWNTPAPIQGCGPGAQHGVQLSYVSPGVVNDILDHYTPFSKQLAANYSLSYAVQGLVTAKALPAAEPVQQTAQQAVAQAQEAIVTLQSQPGSHTTAFQIISDLISKVEQLLGLGG